MRIENNASITRQFPLPGSNASNHIEAINYVDGGTVITTADATPSPDYSDFDISRFRQTGTCIGTEHIIADISLQNRLRT